MLSAPLPPDERSPRRPLALALVAALLFALPATAAELPKETRPFVEKNCADCHDAQMKKGGFDLLGLKYDPADPANLAQWTKVHDRLLAHEMPPKDEPQPAAAELKTFLDGLASTLVADDRAAVAREGGRAVQRRLNRYEYENALRDLLNVPWAQVKDKLPLDGESHGFNKSGEALDVSFVQMERYLVAADYAMRQAMSAAFERPESKVLKIYARDSGGNYLPRENGTLPDRLSFPVLDSHAQIDVRYGRANNSTDPAIREREAIGKVSSIFSDSGGLTWGFTAPTAGRYRIRLKGYSIWVSGGGIGRWMFDGQGAEKAGTYWLPVWHRPNADEIWPGRNNEPMGFYASSTGQTRPIGVGDFTPESSVIEIEAQLAGGESVRTDAMRFFRTRVNGTDEQYVNPLATNDGMPGYAVQWLEVEGPLEDPTITSGYKFLFGDLPMRRLEPGQVGGVPLEGLALGGGGGGRGAGAAPGGAGRGGVGRGGAAVAPPAGSALPVAAGVAPDGTLAQDGGAAPGGARGGVAAAGGRGGRGGGAAPARGTGARGGGRGGRGGAGGGGGLMVEVFSENPKQDAERLLRNFMRVAYRRPVREADVARFLGLFQREADLGSGFARSMLTAYTGVLASPGFVFLEEQPGKLDGMMLATRLSLFLWNSVPDAALRALAEKGELAKPEVLRAETERLLNDPRAARFVEAFTDYWLDLRKIDDTSPSSTIYNDYEMDDPLKLAAMDETRMFFAEVLRADLPARAVVDSDFTFLNQRLAQHYGIPGVEGARMRRVALPPGSDRGGLMTMASVLKVTANGTTTSPVLRGKWITERILGLEIPPPPPVAAVEPDIRGAVTIREQLAKHRADASCASCHIKMDPPGFALESYDVMGGRRERYRAVSEEVKPVRGFGMSGQAFAFHHGPLVDSTGELPDGRPFKDVRDFKALLLQDELPVARNLAKQLVTFATGASVRFSERAELEEILQSAAPGRYGVRTLIHGVVQSALFQTK